MVQYLLLLPLAVVQAALDQPRHPGVRRLHEVIERDVIP